jgi:hypothetical protein
MQRTSPAAESSGRGVRQKRATTKEERSYTYSRWRILFLFRAVAWNAEPSAPFSYASDVSHTWQLSRSPAKKKIRHKNNHKIRRSPPQEESLCAADTPRHPIMQHNGKRKLSDTPPSAIPTRLDERAAHNNPENSPSLMRFIRNLFRPSWVRFSIPASLCFDLPSDAASPLNQGK